MIIRRGDTWWRTVFAVRTGTVMQQIWRRWLLVGALAISVTYYHHLFELKTGLTVAPFSLVGLALSIFLGFRNNTSYDRFWEGRKLWGALVNTSRSLARQLLTLVRPASEALRRELIYRVIAYVHGLRLHLRDDDDLSVLEKFLPEEEVEALRAEKNRPAAIAHRLAERLRDLYDDEAIHAFHLASLDRNLGALIDIQGGCERIKATPIPYSYNVLIHRIVAVYCFSLPFGLVTTTNLFTPVVVLIVSYAFFGLDALGDQIEEPFGVDPNDLPLDTLCAIIETNLRQRLGETQLPKIPDGVIQT
ncbi:MAG: bestrophin [Myxococcales bacterium]|nr:bestrophin [Myxococcales bacterium]